MRLIRSADKGLEQTEHPLTAARLVNDALMRGRLTIDGLNQIGSQSRITSDSEIVEAVRRGDLLLVRPHSSSWGGGSMPRPSPAPEPVHIAQDHWPLPKPRDDLVFAKSYIAENWCRTDAGTTTEPASNFGQIMVAGAMLFPSASTAIATALGADLALGRMAGGGILQQRLNWVIRGAGGPASVFLMGMLPAKMADGTLYLVFARPFGGDHSYHPAPKELTAFPEAKRAKQMSSVQGGGNKRSRWKDRKGKIYEWDYENGRVELYSKQGKHLGEFNPETGEQTKDAEPGRTTPK